MIKFVTDPNSINQVYELANVLPHQLKCDNLVVTWINALNYIGEELTTENLKIILIILNLLIIILKLFFLSI